MDAQRYKQLLLEQLADEVDDAERCQEKLDAEYDRGSLSLDDYEEQSLDIELELEQLNDKLESYAMREAEELYREWRDEVLEASARDSND